MLHRFGAVVVTALVFTSAILIARRTLKGSRIRSIAIAAPFLVLIQGTLGVLSVTSLLHLPTVTAHLGVGALVLASMVALWALIPAAGHAPGNLAPRAPRASEDAPVPA
jgi:heme A synthase